VPDGKPPPNSHAWRKQSVGSNRLGLHGHPAEDGKILLDKFLETMEQPNYSSPNPRHPK